LDILEIKGESYSVNFGLDAPFVHDVLWKQLQNGEYTVNLNKQKEPSEIITNGGALLKLKRDSGDIGTKISPLSLKPWVNVGTILDYDKISQNYPFLTEYEWGGIYNNKNPMPLMIMGWNRGIRVLFRDFYPHGDNPISLHIGNSMWTRDTDDSESKGVWKHRYINSSYAVCCGSNGVGGLSIYVRKL